ncbi:helix-turn-helix domain-containing protein, partial [[Clostridium] symbiosum]
VWGASSEVEDGNLDNYIYFLRRRLRTLNAPVKITTVHGVGYRLEKIN